MQEEWLPDRDDTDSTPGHKRHSDTARRPYVRVIRPLRDVGRKECALWAWWRGLSVVGKERWPWSGAKQDIGSLTRGVFYCLAWCTQSHVQDKSSSTASRRTTPPPSQRSSAHAQRSSPKANQQGYAPYARGTSPLRTCNASPDRTRRSPIQAGIQEWQSRISIRSRDDSHLLPSPASTSLAPHLCYGCHTTLTSRSSRPAPSLGLPPPDRSTVPLPLWVGPGMPRSRMGEQQMKDVVSEFLLEDDT